MKSLNKNYYNDIKDSGYYWVERLPQSTVEETVRKVEGHFGFFKEDLCIEDFEIAKVERSTELADSLLKSD